MGRRKNYEIINSELLEVDIYGDEDTIVETIGQRIRRISRCFELLYTNVTNIKFRYSRYIKC